MLPSEIKKIDEQAACDVACGKVKLLEAVLSVLLILGCEKLAEAVEREL